MWQDLTAGIFGTSPVTDPVIVAGRMLAALILGGAIGFEREMKDKAAGLRTHILISMAACLFALIGIELTRFPPPGEGELAVDPLRLIEAVTAGVAFLAAGTIISSDKRVLGLTTGAGMWLAGAVGVACGIGQVGLAAMAAVLALVVLWVFERLTRQFD